MALRRGRRRDLPLVKMRRGDRFRQWWHASRDRRRGLPQLVDGRAEEIDTPHAQRLRHECAEAIESVRQLALADTAEHRERIARLHAQIEHDEQQLPPLYAALAAAEPTPEELTQRRPGEADLPDSIIRDRRARDAERRLADIRTRIGICEHQLAAARAQVAELEAEVTTIARCAQTLAERIDAYTQVRQSRYWRAVVRSHPQGRQITALLRPAATEPTWITDPDPWSALNQTTVPARSKDLSYA